MKIENINITESIEKTRKQIASDKSLSPAIKSAFDLLILINTLLVNRLNLNSSNSSKPPSQDPNRKKKTRKDKGIKKGKRKPGAQNGHEGKTLTKIDNPDEIEEILIDRRTIPPGKYTQIDFETRQVFDIKLSYHVKEYRAEVLEDVRGNKYVAVFPEDVKKAVQYGNEVKAESVYMSVSQLIPLARVEDYFNDQVGLPISKGSVDNFKKDACDKLEKIGFTDWAKKQLTNSPVDHADETGININGKKAWLHNLSNDKVTLYHPDEKRGQEAMDRMGILPHYKGVLCHDHWKPYYNYDCDHSLCNAHHLRELARACEQDNQKWAKKMATLLNKINELVKESDGVLSSKKIKFYQKRYRAILDDGKKECPLYPRKEGQKGKIAKSKSRNLLDRLINFEEDALRFMKEKLVPFTNNQGENDLRMTKVQQKISGCFRSMDGAKEFCLIRSYLVTARKNGVRPTDALRMLFNGKIPPFMKKT
jgi:transposase